MAQLEKIDQSNQKEKIEGQIIIRSSVERFFHIFSKKQYLLPNICPELVVKIELINGHWDSVGSVRQWTYNLPDIPCPQTNQKDKVLVDAIDEINKTITTKIQEGDALKDYKSFIYTIGVTHNTAKITIEYETKKECVPPPYKYEGFWLAVFARVDAYLCNLADA